MYLRLNKTVVVEKPESELENVQNRLKKLEELYHALSAEFKNFKEMNKIQDLQNQLPFQNPQLNEINPEEYGDEVDPIIFKLEVDEEVFNSEQMEYNEPVDENTSGANAQRNGEIYGGGGDSVGNDGESCESSHHSDYESSSTGIPIEEHKPLILPLELPSEGPFVHLTKLSAFDLFPLRILQRPHSHCKAKCPLCPFILNKNKKKEFLVHLRGHTGDQPFKCPHCPFISDYKAKVKRHIRSIHLHISQQGEVSYRCAKCPLKFSLKIQLRKHFCQGFKCYFCDGSFSNGKALEGHLNKHTGYQCEACEFSTGDHWVLKRHLKDVHQSGNSGSGEYPIFANLQEDKFSENRHIKEPDSAMEGWPPSENSQNLVPVFQNVETEEQFNSGYVQNECQSATSLQIEEPFSDYFDAKAGSSQIFTSARNIPEEAENEKIETKLKKTDDDSRIHVLQYPKALKKNTNRSKYTNYLYNRFSK